MPKTRMNASQRRRSIIDAAIKVISESNYYEATTAKIAAEAGVSEPIIYLHFTSKKELFLELLDEIRNLVISLFQSFIADKENTFETLRQLMAAHFEFVMAHGELHKIITMAASVNDDDIRNKLAEIFRDMRSFFRNQFKKTAKSQKIPLKANDDAAAVTMVAWIILAGTIRVVGAEKYLTRKDFDRFMDMIENSFKK